MRSVQAILAAAGLSCGMMASAQPPVPVTEMPVRIEPIAIAPAWIENGKVVIGEWQDYSPVQTRGRKGMYYAFDAYGGYISSAASRATYVNNAYGGLGASSGQTRWPGSTGCFDGQDGPPWDAAPMVVEDIESQACGAQGGFPIDGLDFAWHWGGETCVVTFFTSDESSDYSNGDPLGHDYLGGVAINLGEWWIGGYYFWNVDGIYSQYDIFIPMPRSGGSYMGVFTDDAANLDTSVGTFFRPWGTGEDTHEPYRAGTQNEGAWVDCFAPFGSFGETEHWSLESSECPYQLGASVGFLALRCPADVNWDGFVNADDYDLFAENFDVAARCADVNGDGFVNGDDFDAFASWFDEGC